MTNFDMKNKGGHDIRRSSKDAIDLQNTGGVSPPMGTNRPKSKKLPLVKMVVLPPIKAEDALCQNDKSHFHLRIPRFHVKPAYNGTPTELDKAEGDKRLKVVVEILAEADLKRLQELVESRAEVNGKQLGLSGKNNYNSASNLRLPQ